MLVAGRQFAKRTFKGALLIFALVASTAAIQAEDNPLNPVRPRTPLTVEKAGGEVLGFGVELSLTNKDRALGLMYRAELAPDHGMLFIFPDTRPRSFWMRNTEIPLDIIFLRDDGSIVNIVREAEPRTETPRKSTAAAKAVFEIAGGRAAELGIKPGDIVRHALLGNMKPASSGISGGR